ncbi:Dual specificity mitogen-activated protein kinase kinase 4 [Trichinella pseudospiralis]|uniref:mitogen-activated protein kinase kinase n=3 Tax=Trichinella pseudospiralis TaxID=6337 RepID=A0A0V1ETI0_TRIPS|nr:Dual specificity mitogen-activated protein kinase kinase 4 [Trichinella pseudospiralis]KRY77145.1 Dual specificity mitogen-activated protein kinase kinase 4 [Trichinella pseudospiralis]
MNFLMHILIKLKTVMSRRPLLKNLDFSQVSTRKCQQQGSDSTMDLTKSGGYTWPAVNSVPQLDIIRSQSSGILKISPEKTFEFTADDLEDLGEIGQGSFGVVYKMRHRISNTVMAVKRMHSTIDDKEQKQLLMDLDVIMRSDECPYIVQFYGAIFREGDCWICMELMDTSLERFYKMVYENAKQRLPEPIIGKIAVATVKALSYLKDKLHIIHRDVKPSNILLDRSGRIKLCDFGIAGKLVDSIARTRDAGCKPYMAPERIDPCKSRRGYDVRADVWSLGITLVEIATGQFPYPPWNSVFDQLQQVVDGDPPLISPKDYPFFSMDFIYFVNCCLMKDEEQRPKYKQLLETKFITKYEREVVDVGAYVCSVFDSNASISNE